MTALILMRSWLSYLREQRAKVHALPGLQWIFPESYCNSGVIPLKYAYLPFSSNPRNSYSPIISGSCDLIKKQRNYSVPS